MFLRISLIFVLLLTGPLLAQVNTESLRKHDLENGFHNDFSFKFNYSNGNTEYQKYNADYRLDYQFPNWNGFFVGKLNKGFKQTDTILNKGFFHFRLLRPISTKISVEGFAQYNFDDFINMDKRYLFGSGIRYLLPFNADGYDFTAYLGLGIMHEYERLNSHFETNYIRITNYLTVVWSFFDRYKYTSTSYIQPYINNMGDYRIFSDHTFSIKINDWLSTFFEINLRQDSLPPDNLKKHTFTFTNGLSFHF